MGFRPTHVVNEFGAPTWTAADAQSEAAAPLARGLAVEVTRVWGDWAHVRCENGWEAWTDGRRLVPITAMPAAARGAPSGRFPLVVSIGAAMAALGALLPWYSTSDDGITAFDIPLWALVANTTSSGGINTGAVVVVCGLAALAVWLRPQPHPAVLIALACFATNPAAFGMVRWLSAENPRPTLGIGLVMSFVGGIIVLFAGWQALNARLRKTAQ